MNEEQYSKLIEIWLRKRRVLFAEIQRARRELLSVESEIEELKKDSQKAQCTDENLGFCGGSE